MMGKQWIVIGMAAALILGGCGGNRKAAIVTVSETARGIGLLQEEAAVEYVSDEDWDIIVGMRKIIMENYGAAREMVSSGYADPGNSVGKAGELIRRGSACRKEEMPAAEAKRMLHQMVDTADDIMNMIERGGRGITEAVGAAEENTEKDPSGAAGECGESTGATIKPGGGKEEQ